MDQETKVKSVCLVLGMMLLYQLIMYMKNDKLIVFALLMILICFFELISNLRK
jgi:hypothetical protein